MHKLTRYVLSMLVIMSIGCGRKKAESSSVRIALPDAPSALGKVSANSFDPTPFCYIVNIVGDGISQVNAPCGPPEGATSGFAAPSSVVEVSVPRGTGRTVELFGYVPRSGETCGSVSGSLGSVP